MTLSKCSGDTISFHRDPLQKLRGHHFLPGPQSTTQAGQGLGRAAEEWGQGPAAAPGTQPTPAALGGLPQGKALGVAPIVFIFSS